MRLFDLEVMWLGGEGRKGKKQRKCGRLFWGEIAEKLLFKSNIERERIWKQSIEVKQLLRTTSPHQCIQNDLISIFRILAQQAKRRRCPFLSPTNPSSQLIPQFEPFPFPIPTHFPTTTPHLIFPKVAYLPLYPSLLSINKINQSYNLLINNERNYDLYIIIQLENCLTFTMKLANHLRHLFSSSKMTSQQCIQLEHEYGCNNYAPLPVVIDSAQGIYVKDCEGKRYIDFLSAYSAVNQGHLHPKILKTFLEQAQKLTLTSRAVHSNLLGQAEMKLAKTFGYDKVLFMNTGVQAGESAIKFARRWGYAVKNVEPNQATVLFAKGNFWGRTIAACASSDDPERYQNFGPFNGLNFSLVDYGSTSALEAEFQKNKNIVGFMVEPIQGEKGVVVPPEGYLRKVRELCNKYNVLLICDEIQTGLGRTGKLICSTHDEVRPDLLLLGKALSGGFMPVSAVLCDNVIMDNIKPGEHGSTYGGNPLACAVTMTAIDVLIEEKMSENSAIMGDYLISQLRSTLTNSNIIKDIRGKGLFIGIEFIQSDYAYRFADRLVQNGLIAKPTQRNIIRFSPPLIITKPQIDESLEMIQKSWREIIQ